MTYVTGWCSAAPGVHAHCESCPGTIPERTWNDPGKKGATYTTPARTCEHGCHTRQFTEQPVR
jgi:hypothetical protein